MLFEFLDMYEGPEMKMNIHSRVSIAEIFLKYGGLTENGFNKASGRFLVTMLLYRASFQSPAPQTPSVRQR